MSHRTDQVSEVIRHNLSQLLLEKIELPVNSSVSIMRVEVSPDLKYATIWIGISPDEQRGVVYGRLRDARVELQEALAENSELRFTPKLRFRVDDGAQAANEVAALLDQIHHEND